MKIFSQSLNIAMFSPEKLVYVSFGKMKFKLCEFYGALTRYQVGISHNKSQCLNYETNIETKVSAVVDFRTYFGPQTSFENLTKRIFYNI